MALRKAMDADTATWPELVAMAPMSDASRAALLSGEPEALDALATELNESRVLTAPDH